MPSELAAIARRIMRSCLPVPDFRQRQAIRSAARDLRDFETWPGEDATGEQAAVVALTRLLGLQRETRRASSLRQREAAALLGRTCIETCLMGLYCLDAQRAVERIDQGVAKSVRQLLSFLLEGDFLPPGVLEAALETLGVTKSPPTANELVQGIVNDSVKGTAETLYSRYYEPLSMFYAHASGMALQRHLSADNSVLETARPAWSRRSAVRIADATVGVLAAQIADTKGIDDHAFARYAEKHLDLALPPLLVVFGDGLRRPQFGELPGVLRAWRRIVKDAQMRRLRSDPLIARMHIEDVLDRTSRFAGVGPDRAMRAVFVDTLVEALTTEEDEPPAKLSDLARLARRKEPSNRAERRCQFIFNYLPRTPRRSADESARCE